MKISVKQYAQSLYESVVGKSEGEVKEIVAKFATSLRLRNDLPKLKEIINSFSDIWNDANQEIHAELTSARKLNADSHELIVNYLKKTTGAKKIEIKENINPEIVGGFILKYGSRVLDGSLKTSLETLKNKISN